MKTRYTEYVKSCMKFYISNSNPIFKDKVSKQDWYACENALNSLSDEERHLILDIYTKDDTISNNITKISTKLKIKQIEIWGLIDKFDKRIAKNRGLL